MNLPLLSGAPWLITVDLTMGLGILVAGYSAWLRRPRQLTGLWIILAADLWFLPYAYPATILWHRAAIVVAILTFPGLRQGRGRWTMALMFAAAAVTPPPLAGDVSTLVLAGLLAVASVALATSARGSSQPPSPTNALPAGIMFSAALAVGPIARVASWQVPTAGVAVAYAVLAGGGVILLGYATVRDSERRRVSRLVVEFGRETRSTSARVGRLVGDPSLTLGIWLADSAAYVDSEGHSVSTRQQSRVVTEISDADGSRVAILVHRPSVSVSPRLTEAIASIARLSASTARSRSQTRQRLHELEASRHRLVRATDAERRRVAAELNSTVGAALARTRGHLTSACEAAEPEMATRIAAAITELDAATVELFELARGTLPRALVAGGLAEGLEEAVGRCPVPTEVLVEASRVPPEIESTVYFVCLEGMGNAVKHSSASKIAMTVRAEGGTVIAVVSDNGRGVQAEVEPMTGIRGIRDRVEALGGTLELRPGPDGGTTLRAAIPIERVTRPSSTA